MGFETYYYIFYNQYKMYYETSLWDLKLKPFSYTELVAEYYETSLWDLKLLILFRPFTGKLL